jgi:hypothetical protein
MEASMNRKTKRSSVVKNPRNVSPRDSSVGSDQGTVTTKHQPFGKKTSAATHLPSKTREHYVNQDEVSNGMQSTQNVVGDHSSIYLNTEEAATRMAEDGINHNIEEAV